MPYTRTGGAADPDERRDLLGKLPWTGARRVEMRREARVSERADTAGNPNEAPLLVPRPSPKALGHDLRRRL